MFSDKIDRQIPGGCGYENSPAKPVQHPQANKVRVGLPPSCSSGAFDMRE
jgi:hypothetical protein